MASGQLLINVQQKSAVPLDNPIPASQEYTITAATSTFDGTSAVGQFLPALQIIGPGGIVAATFVDWSNAVAAGDSVEVTFGPFLKQAATPATPCNHLTVLIEILGPNALWILDEVGGITADDTSGNHHDLTPTTTTPAWAAGASPAGTNWPKFTAGQSFGGLGATKTYSPNLSGDFTFLALFETDAPRASSNYGIASQGDPINNHSGWGLSIEGVNVGLGSRLSALIGTGGPQVAIEGDVTMTGGVPWFVGVSHTSGVWSLYVNGARQTSTYSGAYNPTAARFVLGGPASAFQFSGYNMLFVPSISDSDIALLYQAL